MHSSRTRGSFARILAMRYRKKPFVSVTNTADAIKTPTARPTMHSAILDSYVSTNECTRNRALLANVEPDELSSIGPARISNDNFARRLVARYLVYFYHELHDEQQVRRARLIGKKERREKNMRHERRKHISR